MMLAGFSFVMCTLATMDQFPIQLRIPLTAPFTSEASSHE